MLTETQHAEATTWVERIDQCEDNLEMVLQTLDEFLKSGLPYYQVLDKVFEKATLLDPRLETVATVWHKLYGKGSIYPGWKHFPDEGYGFWDTELDGLSREEEESMMAGTWDFQRLWWKLSDEALEKIEDFDSALALLRISSEHSKAGEKVRELATTPEHALAWLEYKRERGEGFSQNDLHKFLQLAKTNRVRLALLNNQRLWEHTLGEEARNLPQQMALEIRKEEHLLAGLRAEQDHPGFVRWILHLLGL